MSRSIITKKVTGYSSTNVQGGIQSNKQPNTIKAKLYKKGKVSKIPYMSKSWKFKIFINNIEMSGHIEYSEKRDKWKMDTLLNTQIMKQKCLDIIAEHSIDDILSE